MPKELTARAVWALVTEQEREVHSAIVTLTLHPEALGLNVATSVAVRAISQISILRAPKSLL